MSLQRRTGPRGTDVHHLGKVLPSTLQRYRDALRPFVAFLLENHFNPVDASEFDDLFVEFKHEHTPRRAAFEATVAALEFAAPPLKGHLPWSRAVLSGWHISDPIHHTVPMLRAPARFLCCHMAALGRPRVGAGMVLQRELGLRPGEAVGVRPDDVTLPEQMTVSQNSRRAVVALGTRKSTKAKRVQSVVVRNPVVIGLLRWLVKTAQESSKDCTLMGCSYDSYRNLLRSTQAQAGLAGSYTPHSPRAGFATESVAEGQDFVTVREGGRWLSDSSLRIYLDLVGAASLDQQHRLSGRGPELAWAAAHFLDFLPGAADCQLLADYNGASCEDPFINCGPGERTRWTVVPTMGPSQRRDPRWVPPSETAITETGHATPSDDDGSGSDRVTFELRPPHAKGNDKHSTRGRGRGAQGRGGSQGRGKSSQGQ